MQRAAAIVALLAATPLLATACGGTSSAPAAGTVSGTVACTTSQGSLQIDAIAYRPSLGYAIASVTTGFANTPATIHLIDVESDKAKYAVNKSCSPTTATVPLTHRGLTAGEVVKAGYDQSQMVYCGAPGQILVRYRIELASSGNPKRAVMSVWAKGKGSGLRQTGYLEWSRSLATSYYAKQSCTSQ
jgi:hypothetical protein